MKVLVIGDVLFDRYTYVETERMSQEADIPVYDVVDTDELRLGGAANVAANIRALANGDVEVHLAGIMMREDVELFSETGIALRMCSYGDQLDKHRFVEGSDIAFRIDNKKKFDDDRVALFDVAVRNNFDDSYDAIVISDYDKGSITPAIAKRICRSDAMVMVDSKRYDLSIFEGADVLNINESEYSTQVSNPLYTNVERLFDCVIVTLGAMGAKLLQCSVMDEKQYIVYQETFPTESVDVVDVTGCGDTHTAALVVGLLRDPKDIRSAIRFANSCATLAVQRFGTARISRWDFLKSSSDAESV